jgi:hypothetical protein
MKKNIFMLVPLVVFTFIEKYRKQSSKKMRSYGLDVKNNFARVVPVFSTLIL